MQLELNADQLKIAREATGLGEDAKPEALAAKLVELAGKGAGAGQAEAQVTTLSNRVRTLEGELAEARKSKPADVPPEFKALQDQLIGQEREGVEEKIDALVKLSRITPAEATELKAELAGAADSPNRTLLSRGANGSKSAASKLVAVVEKILTADRPNAGTKTGPQVFSLGRHAGGEDPSKPSDWVAEELKG